MLLFSILISSISLMSNAEEATTIEISEELSLLECYSGKSLWVNGTATYDNSTPVKDTEIVIQINENEMDWKTQTDSNGNYQMQISATGRYIDQSQVYINTTTDWIKSTTRVGQTFRPNETDIQSIGIYLLKSSPSPTSSFMVHIRDLPNATSDISNATLMFNEIEDGWNNFTFPSPVGVTPGDEYFILLTSNTTSGSYANKGSPWNTSLNYEHGMVYWEGDPMEPSIEQDIAFITYYEKPLPPGEYTINVSVEGQNSTGSVYGFNEATLTVIIADLLVTDNNLQIICANDPPLNGNEIIFNITVQNQGDGPAYDFNVDFSLDSEGNVFATRTLSLGALEEGIASCTWVAQVGDHTIFVTADFLDIIHENLETNNNASLHFFVDGDNDLDGIGNLSDSDDDNDGYSDAIEIAEATDPLDASSKPADNDGDYIPDSMDPDDDNDGYSDIIEIEIGTNPNDDSSVPDDYDYDFIPDSMDSDIDNDSVANEEDDFPYDTLEWLDTDADGIGNNADTDDDCDGVPDEEDDYPLDTDDDGLTNDIDWDDDADGILDTEDTKLLDTDNDGLRNDEDADDDGDGLSDSEEKKKHTNPLKSDTDGDGVNDKKDFDPLDSEVTSDPGFPMIYLLVPLFVVVILALIILFTSSGFRGTKAASVGEGYRELVASERKSEVLAGSQTQEIPPSPEYEGPAPSDELAQLEEEIEEPSKQKQDDELADLEEEFEESLS